MKQNSNIRRYSWHRPLSIIICAMGLTMLFSCSLNEEPRDQIPEEEALDTAEELYRNTVATLYNYIGGAEDGQGLQGTCRGVYDLQTFGSDEAMLPTRGGDWTDGVRPDGSKLTLDIDGQTVNAWEAVVAFCTDIEDEGFQLERDYSDNFIVNNERSRENIWVIAMDKDLYKTQQQNLFRSYHYRHAAAYGFTAENGTCATRKVLQVFGYETDDEDTRFSDNYWAGYVFDLDMKPVPDREGNTLCYLPWEVQLDLSGSPYVETAGARMKKYEVDPNATKDGKLMDNDIVLFRYADVLLMRAEALLRNGQADAGQPYFDAVRHRAFMPTRPLTLDNIYDERLLELCWEGWRRQDMIRFGRYASLSQNDGSGSNVDESDGHTTVYPIPADVLALNSNLRQNKGY